ncbi:MAG: carboxypeptidase-like regulatory domain-containing protein, partial [Bacteroidales bacterium]|nr:carboxypeptidase-like regulatory domain-containing protein [Bacteroidales bacterium]
MRIKLFLLLILLFPIVCFSQQKQEIKGCVLDSKNGKPIPFANVQVNNLTIGTSTDIDGCFKIIT